MSKRKLRKEYREQVGSTYNMKWEWYAEWLEERVIKAEFKQKNDTIATVSCSDYRDKLQAKLDSMKKTADKMFTKKGYETANMVLDNVKVHIDDIHDEHYS